jgi:hypothetical protein
MDSNQPIDYKAMAQADNLNIPPDATASEYGIRFGKECVDKLEKDQQKLKDSIDEKDQARCKVLEKTKQHILTGIKGLQTMEELAKIDKGEVVGGFDKETLEKVATNTAGTLEKFCEDDAKIMRDFEDSHQK